jgi:hypothetical protein
MASNKDEIELKNLDEKSKDDEDSIDVEGSENIRNESNQRDEEQDEDTDEEQKPFLDKSKSEHIEMKEIGERTLERADDAAESSSLLEATTNLDDIVRVESHAGEDVELNLSSENVNHVRNKKGRLERIKKYISLENPYVRGFKPTKIKVVYLAILAFVLFLVIVLPNCITSIRYHHVNKLIININGVI